MIITNERYCSVIDEGHALIITVVSNFTVICFFGVQTPICISYGTESVSLFKVGGTPRMLYYSCACQGQTG